jgi:hypothetical protein
MLWFFDACRQCHEQGMTQKAQAAVLARSDGGLPMVAWLQLSASARGLNS